MKPEGAELPRLRGELLRERRRLALGQADLEDVERVPDQRVVADDRDHLDEPIFTERLDRLAEARLRQALGAEHLVAGAIDQRLVLLGEDRGAAGADRLDRGGRNTGFLGKR